MKCKQILRVCVAGQDDAELVVVDGVGVFILSECWCRSSTTYIAITSDRHPQAASETRRHSRIASTDTRHTPLSL